MTRQKNPLKNCIEELEEAGQLARVKEEVNPHLEMAAIHRRVYKEKGPALLFENVKGSPFPAVSNLFGTHERWRWIFRHHLPSVKNAVSLKANPQKFAQTMLKEIWKNPLPYLKLPGYGLASLPKEIPVTKAPVAKNQTTIDKLPQVVCWPEDGGPFITLPQVFSLFPGKKSIFASNLGMYRVQMGGGSYIPNKEVGLHYQIHRGLGIHHSQALAQGEDLPVSIFVGGPPAHTLAAVMPLPENLSELVFAGMLAGRRFRYCRVGEHILSADADFCITGWIRGTQVKPEGPFGDHLGYYSLVHDFPVLQVDRVYHRDGALWPFTVVGRPPQEDTSFGQMIHEIARPMVPTDLPGVKDLHAVDEAGVHPLLLAVGSERYVPYRTRVPAEIITQAHAILGFNQCSLAKYLLMTAHEDKPSPNCHDPESFFHHILRRVDWSKDLHFQTQTTMDTLDYSSPELNFGSKLILATCGKIRRTLKEEIPPNTLLAPPGFSSFQFVSPGILALGGPSFTTYKEQEILLKTLEYFLKSSPIQGFPLVVLCDQPDLMADDFKYFLWVTFTRSNPSHDIYGSGSFIRHKHWGCGEHLIIDARIKPFHAKALE